VSKASVEAASIYSGSSTFIRVSAIRNRSPILDLIMADIDTLLLDPALVAKRQSL
jgi:hypothetical protein